MNVLTASGNLGRDCRLSQTQSGTAVVGFAVAMKSGYGDNEQTVWVDCSLFGNRANSLAPYLVKGQQVVVSGEMGTREHEGKTYVTLRCNDVTLVGGKPAQQAPQPQQGGFQQAPQQPQRAPAQQAPQQPQGGFQQQAPAPQPTAPQAPVQPEGSGFEDFDDDIPFS